MEQPKTTPSPDDPSARWQPLSAVDRRVLGVLVEKAKTTPEQYPLSLNALRTGSNQKSNRHPIMQLDGDAIEESLERLRGLGAVVEVQGSGRVVRYRHLLYQWLAVEKVELAVMAELLLRGAQKVGELRGRVARMEPLRDMASLQPLLDSLEAKTLIEYLTPKGRGCVVTHRLYLPNEMAKVRAQFAAAETLQPAGVRTAGTAVQPMPPAASASETASFATLQRGIESLREEVQAQGEQLNALRDELRQHVGRTEETC